MLQRYYRICMCCNIWFQKTMMSTTDFEQSPSNGKSNWEKINSAVKMTPTMIFSVIGDSDSFVPYPWPRTVFQTALIEAAKSGGNTWILFRNDANVVSKTVWDAYQTYGNMEFSTENKEIGYENEKRRIKLINVAESSDPANEQEISGKELYNIFINDMLDFEKFMSEQKGYFSREMTFEMPVPFAIIVCVGDIRTIEHISSALKSKIPVIIIKGSGMAADLILKYLESPEVLQKEASVVFGVCVEDTCYRTLEHSLKAIREKKNLVGVFDLDNDDPLKLSNIIGETVVTCWSIKKILPRKDVPCEQTSCKWEEKTLDQFPPNSRSYVFNPKFASPTSLPLYFYYGYQLLEANDQIQEKGHIILLEALKANLCDYVLLLLDQRVKLSKKDLPELYDKTVACENCNVMKSDEEFHHMQWILKQYLEDEAEVLCSLNKKSNEGINQSKKSNCFVRKQRDKIDECARRLCRSILRYDVKDVTNSTDVNDYVEISDLLLWAIFANRKELAKIFWLRSQDHLLTGQMCSILLKNLSGTAMDFKEQGLSTDLAEHAQLFQRRYIGIMDGICEENTKNAIVLDENAEIWGITSNPLAFAYENEMYEVLAHSCSQKILNNKWFNSLPQSSFRALEKLIFPKTTLKQYFRQMCSPVLLYGLNYWVFFAVLVMYSTFVLSSIHTMYYVQGNSRFYEYCVYLWSAGDFIDELTMCFGCTGKNERSRLRLRSRLLRYVNDFWNIMDLLSHALVFSALFVRHLKPSETFTLARRLYSLSVLVMYLRFLKVFLIKRSYGLTLLMMKEMLKDLISFLLIALFVILGVGIYYHAILFPDHQTIWSGDWTEWRIWKIIYYPYWQMYAELNLEYLEGEVKNCTTVTAEWETGIMDRCPQRDWTVSAIAGMYLLLSNLLLINLVIAKFSYTFERVQENSENYFWYARYTAIDEYHWRIPSPFNFVDFFRRLVLFCCGEQKSRRWCINNVEDNGTQKEKITVYRRELQKILAYRITSDLKVGK